MTKLLERAFAEASRLSPPEQDAIAEWLLKEIESESRWDESFARSQNGLSALAAEALSEHRRGETETLDPDDL